VSRMTLGVNRNTLQFRMRLFGIVPPPNDKLTQLESCWKPFTN